MDFKIPDTQVPDWRVADLPESPTSLAPRPMSEQLWELLDGFKSTGEIAELMQGFAQIDRAVHPDGTFDTEEWRIAAAAMRRGLDKRGDVYHPNAELTTAFAAQIAAALARR